MRKLLLVILLSVSAGLAIFGCSDKSTEPDDGDDYELRHARLYAHVEYDDGTPVEGTRVWLYLYDLPNDTIWTLGGTSLTDEYGITMVNFAVLAHRDTVVSYVKRTGYISDTIIFRIEYEGQVFGHEYHLIKGGNQ